MVSKREAKLKAQEMLLHGIGNVLGYWSEDMVDTEDVAKLGISEDEFHKILHREADRIAKLFGYEEAWTN